VELTIIYLLFKAAFNISEPNDNPFYKKYFW
jgi:hypothetical protein